MTINALPMELLSEFDPLQRELLEAIANQLEQIQGGVGLPADGYPTRQELINATISGDLDGGVVTAGASGGGTSDHGNLTGLADDDHPQYLTETRADALYEPVGGGSSDHGGLSGLSDDDHAQYHNDTRGDARYYTQSALDTSLAGKAASSHTHLAADVTDGVFVPAGGSLDQVLAKNSGTDGDLKWATVSGGGGGTTYMAPRGFALSNNASDAAHDLDIAAGVCVDTTNAELIDGGAMTKRIDATWVAGTTNGGLDTGSVTFDEIYAVWAILKDSDDSVDYLFSLSFTWSGVTKPTGYSKGELIGAVATDGFSNLMTFVQVGDHTYFGGNDHAEEIVNDTSITTNTWETATAHCVPPNAVAIGTAGMFNTTSGQAHLVSVAPVGTTGNPDSLSGIAIADVPSGFARLGGYFTVPVDASQQFLYVGREPAGSASIKIFINGFTMPNRFNGT